MPTDDTGNGASPTAEIDNASQVDVKTLTAEQLEANPHFNDLKTKYSAARTGMDESNLSKKELKAEVARLKVLAGEEATPASEPVDDSTKPVTKAELQQQVWELSHQKEVELYGDEEFQKDVTSGIPREYALKTAKLRFQSNPDKARLERQQTMASGTAMGTRDLQSDELTPAEQKGIAEGLYSKETALAYREMKKARGQS